ncbi:Probable Co/Zn/Cd efflux system membrane fusion protein [hydrothermal vent metagenome]|uniref:Probable Co/Zn/Cd efflux system membrane fusion protein n=1 Tax=hydrothermal vent metagenome TaxID=652676 RepID=A0A3B0ZXW4_9ZZZZ
MNSTRKILSHQFWLPLLLATFLTACSDTNSEQAISSEGGHGEATEIEPEKGPHRGRLLRDGDFTLELAIFETGVPPELRVWTTKNGKNLSPDEVELNIKLIRLGGKVDDINFTPEGDALRGDTVIYEPHSFVVKINATHNGVSHQWEYDTFEGRTKIETAVAEALEIKTKVAGSVVMQKTISVYGQIAANSERMRRISARFDGTIKSVLTSQGKNVRKGQKLATVESNESLQLITITAPIAGVITLRDANVGEQTDGRQLFTIMDSRSVWAELSVFPIDLAQVKVGAPVTITDSTSGHIANGKISQINMMAQTNQAVNVRAVLDNSTGQLRPGRHVNAKITVGEHTAALAVKRTGLQSFRDFTVVYEQVGEEYEVRMLELGLQAGEWAEVLGGLDPGTRYVSENSYVIKADIEKSGASHDH